MSKIEDLKKLVNINPIIFIALSTLTIGAYPAFWSLKARKHLKVYSIEINNKELSMNIIYTVVFNIFYVNYCLNEVIYLHQQDLAFKPKSSFRKFIDRRALKLIARLRRWILCDLYLSSFKNT